MLSRMITEKSMFFQNGRVEWWLLKKDNSGVFWRLKDWKLVLVFAGLRVFGAFVAFAAAAVFFFSAGFVSAAVVFISVFFFIVIIKIQHSYFAAGGLDGVLKPPLNDANPWPYLITLLFRIDIDWIVCYRTGLHKCAPVAQPDRATDF